MEIHDTEMAYIRYMMKAVQDLNPKSQTYHQRDKPALPITYLDYGCERFCLVSFKDNFPLNHGPKLTDSSNKLNQTIVHTALSQFDLVQVIGCSSPESPLIQ